MFQKRQPCGVPKEIPRFSYGSRATGRRSEVKGMRIGLMGGAFDPPHLGHLIVAEASLGGGGLDEVWFLPSARPPHKVASELASWEDRLKMIGLAISGNRNFRLEPIEASLPAPNFSFQTLAALKARNPEHEFFLILGEDSLADLPHWRNPREVLQQVGILVYPRMETRPGVDARKAQKGLEECYPEANISWINGVPNIGIASRDLREKCLLGQSIRYQVSPAVEEFIRQKHLYGAKGTP